MKIMFLAKSDKTEHSLQGEVINGFDLTSFPEGAKFTPTEEMKSVGIYNIERVNGELFITLSQCGAAYECQPVNGSHDWKESEEWIDAADYDPDCCYIVATSAPEGAEYIRRQNGWTVAMPETEEPAA